MPVTSESADMGLELGRLIGRLRRSLSVAVREKGGSVGHAHFEVLRVVKRSPSSRVQDVATELGLAPNTVSTIVQQLVERDMLKRESDDADGRVVRLSLTPAAQKKIDAWRRHRGDILGAQIDALSAVDQAVLHQAIPALQRLADGVDAND